MIVYFFLYISILQITRMNINDNIIFKDHEGYAESGYFQAFHGA